jgi:ribosomal protein S7
MELNYENKKIKKLFINILLKKGKKINSEKIFKKLLINIKKITKQKPNKIIKKFINNSSIKIKYIEIQKKKRFINKKWKKKKNLYIFIFLNKDKQIRIPIKWLLLNNTVKNNYLNISKEIIQTSKNIGKIINLKKNYYKEIKKLKFLF